MLSKYFGRILFFLFLLGGFWLLPGEVARAGEAPEPTPQPASQDFAPTVGSLSDYFNRKPVQSSSVVSLAIRSKGGPEQYLADLTAFNELRSQELASPGWLHRLSRHLQVEKGQVVRWQVEGWYEFGATGKLAAAYERRLDADGNVLQPVQKVEIPDRSIILPLSTEPALAFSGEDVSRPAPPLPSPAFDFGFTEFSRAALEAGWLFSSQILYENCWYMGETYNLSNGSLRVTALFYPDTGKLRTLQVYDISGPSIQLIASLELPIEEHLSQPPDLLR